MQPRVTTARAAEHPMQVEHTLMNHRSHATTSWQPLGPHSYRIEDDTIFVRTNGDATLESTVLYTELCKQLVAQNGYVLSVVDMAVSGVAAPEVRRYQAQAARDFPAGSSETAIFGMSPLARTFVQLIARASSLLTGRESGVQFMRDEAAALRWRDERRAVLRSRFGRPRET